MGVRSQQAVLRGRSTRRSRARWVWWFLGLLVSLLAFLALIWTLERPSLEDQVDLTPGTVHAVLRQSHQPYTPIGRISPLMQHAIVAVEDRRFYQHHGIDVHGMLRGLVDDVRNQRLDGGGATITLQLVKRTASLPSNPVLRVLDIAALGWVTEDEFSKRQILELYLNDVYFGRGANGIAAASWKYFRRAPANLGVSQAAFIASLPQSPSYYGDHPFSPVVQSRYRTVIRDMAAQGYITSRQERVALTRRLHFAGSS